MKDDLSESTWTEVSDWLRMRGLALTLKLECGAFVALVHRAGVLGLAPVESEPRASVEVGARWWLSTGTTAGQAIERVLRRCREQGGEATLIERGVVRP